MANSFHKDWVPRVFILVFILLGLTVTSVGRERDRVLTIDEKIKAFDDYQAQKEKYEVNRESALDETLKTRDQQRSLRQRELEAYLEEKKKKKTIRPEETPAYEEYLLSKWEWHRRLEAAADEESRFRRSHKPGVKTYEFELREYALTDTEKNRIPYKKRKLLGGKSGGGSSGSGSHSGNQGAAPFIPPPPIEDVPEFDDDIPPPPPPPPPLPTGGADMGDGFEPISPPPPF